MHATLVDRNTRAASYCKVVLHVLILVCHESEAAALITKALVMALTACDSTLLPSVLAEVVRHIQFLPRCNPSPILFGLRLLGKSFRDAVDAHGCAHFIGRIGLWLRGRRLIEQSGGVRLLVRWVGTDVGPEVGPVVGTDVGTKLGTDVGTLVGTEVGTAVGMLVGKDFPQQTAALRLQTARRGHAARLLMSHRRCEAAAAAVAAAAATAAAAAATAAAAEAKRVRRLQKRLKCIDALRLKDLASLDDHQRVKLAQYDSVRRALGSEVACLSTLSNELLLACVDYLSPVEAASLLAVSSHFRSLLVELPPLRDGRPGDTVYLIPLAMAAMASPPRIHVPRGTYVLQATPAPWDPPTPTPPPPPQPPPAPGARGRIAAELRERSPPPPSPARDPPAPASVVLNLKRLGRSKGKLKARKPALVVPIEHVQVKLMRRGDRAFPALHIE